MNKITIITTRFLTDKQLKDYKEINPLNINWEFLEKNGVCSIYDPLDKTVRSSCVLEKV